MNIDNNNAIKYYTQQNAFCFTSRYFYLKSAIDVSFVCFVGILFEAVMLLIGEENLLDLLEGIGILQGIVSVSRSAQGVEEGPAA